MFRLAIVAAVALLALGGCGGGGDDGGPRTDAKEGSAKQGGTLTALAAGDIDWADPGQSYYAMGFQVINATQRALYGYEPDGTEAVPDLAEAPPEISPDNKTVTVRIRKGVRFSPPVNREVTAEDVEYAFERTFTAAVVNGYVASYFSEIEGVPAKPGKYKDLPGVEATDPNTIVFRLTEPVGGRMAAALTLPITVPVPKEYALEHDAKRPSTYDQYVVATGPYMIRNDSTGKLVGRKPGRLIELVRNPNWSRESDFRPAYLDSIRIEEGHEDGVVAGRRTLRGSKLLCCLGSSNPEPVIAREVREKYPDQAEQVPAGGTYWTAFNTTLKPLDNANVRRAMSAAVDRVTLRKLLGGESVGLIANHILMPGMPGFEEAGGEDGFADAEWLANPEGDPELAREYMLAAKAEGVSVSDDGRYTGDDEILAVYSNTSAQKRLGQFMRTELEELGFKITLRHVPTDALYTKFCGVKASKVGICAYGWLRDFNDAESVIKPTFWGKAIREAGNTNASYLDDPEVNAKIEEASRAPLADRPRLWAEADHLIIRTAAVMPETWPIAMNIVSKDVDLRMNQYLASADLSFIALK